MKSSLPLKSLLLSLAFAIAQQCVFAEDYTKYLFVYFPSNSNENVYYALSDNGYDYTPMNNGQMIVCADTISIKKGVRDPHILRGEDGWFYMVLTDMRSADGWESNRGIVLMRSKDLVNWSHSTVHFPDKYKGTIFEKVIRVWAPETIWDPQAGKYMVYFSLFNNNADIPYDKVYYCYANADFTDLEGEPTFLFDRGSATIDMDIVYNENDQLYHAFYKNEAPLGQSDASAGQIHKVTASTLTAPAGDAPGSQWSEPSEQLQQTDVAVEGAGVFKLIGEDTWVLMYDCYTSGYYQFCTSSDLTNFTFKQNTYTSGAFTPRHGTVIPVTDAEVETINSYLIEKQNEQAAEEFRQLKEALQTEVDRAKLMNVSVSDIETQMQQDELTRWDLAAFRRTLNVRVFEDGLKNYPEDKSSQLRTGWTKSNQTDNKGQHWDGTSTSTYYEQNQGWGSSAWTMYMQKKVTLPAGYYVLKASGRAASDAVVATMSVDDQSVSFPTKGDVGYGITLDGRASFYPTESYANGGAGRGWEWRYLPFSLSEQTRVTFRLDASVANASHQWVSISNLSLLYSPTDPTAISAPSMDGTKEAADETFTLSGQRIARPQAGIQIKRQPDGQWRKVLVK